MSAELVGGDKLRRRLENMTHTDRLLAELQTKVVRAAKNNTRPFRKTGNLGRTIVAGYLDKTSATVRADAPYARYVEEGTGIYGPKKRPITPKNGRFLVFNNPQRTTLGGTIRAQHRGEKGNLIFARSVRGRKATPFMKPAVDTVKKDMGLDKVVVDLWNEGA